MAINPYVPASATGNGSQVDFTFTFPYIFPTHVKAYLNGVQTTAFTFFSTNVLRFTVAPALGVNVLIVRETPGDALAAVIQPGGPLPIVGLNNNFLQSLYYAQETQYDAANQSTAGLQAQITAATATANAASANAGSAVTTANAASATANGIASTANTANTNANNAVTTANTAQATATAAQTTANNAVTAAATAQARADRAPALDTAKAWNWNSLSTNTSIDFTSIPSWVKRITVMFNGVSTSGSSNYLVQIGSGSFVTTGYLSNAAGVGGGGYIAVSSTLGFIVKNGDEASTNVFCGQMILTTPGSNIWIACHNVSSISATPRPGHGAGSVTLSGALDRIRITANGTDTFDAGSINILYE
jgi:hypothetical protein